MGLKTPDRKVRASQRANYRIPLMKVTRFGRVKRELTPACVALGQIHASVAAVADSVNSTDLAVEY
jgi:hypothetical protein